MDLQTLLAAADFSRSRLLGTLDAIEKSGLDVNQALAWRPGPGRAHIAWQAMHCAATHHRYLHVQLIGDAPTDDALVTRFAGGSTPSDDNIPSLPEIRSKLESTYAEFRNHCARLTPEDLQRVGPSKRTVAESLVLLSWHEAHHQGQIHLTFNLFKAMQGVKQER